MTNRAFILSSALVLGACAGTPMSTRVSDPASLRKEVGEALDRLHAAAAKADEDVYLSAFSREGVFLGTAAEERWTVEAFRAYVHPYFSKGHGFVYSPHDRSISFSQDGQVAWFDERLTHERYGELRGTGVLVHEQHGWKVAQYNLTFTVPNDAAKEVVEVIRKPR